MDKANEIINSYASGDHIAAWQALRAMGTAAGEMSDSSRIVVRMFVDRAVHNFEQLVTNLVEVGYKFFSQNPYRRVDASDSEASLINQPQSLPLLMRQWYSMIAHVDLRQDLEQLRSDASGLVSLGFNCTAVFLSLEDGRRMVEQEGLTPMDYDMDPPRPERDAEFICLGGFASNCEAIGYWAEGEPFDPVVYNDGAGPVSMADHVRRIFQWGGFPMWRNLVLSPEKEPSLPQYPDFRRLLPLLRRGLVAL